jgi:hypothetical protein
VAGGRGQALARGRTSPRCASTAGVAPSATRCCRRGDGGASAAELGVQDLVVIAVKGPALSAVAAALAAARPRHPRAAGDERRAVVVQPGVAALGPEPLESRRPGRLDRAAIPLQQCRLRRPRRRSAVPSLAGAAQTAQG